jgi:hypothetical protein
MKSSNIQFELSVSISRTELKVLAGDLTINQGAAVIAEIMSLAYFIMDLGDYNGLKAHATRVTESLESLAGDSV